MNAKNKKTAIKKAEKIELHGEMILFQSMDGHTKIQVRFEEKNVWLSQKAMAELYQVSVKTINEHIVNIYDENELVPEATIRTFRIVQTEGKRAVTRTVDHFNLEAILAVGYRVRSPRGTQFRQWATAQLQELLVKGFVMDDDRLKEGKSIGQDYFDELIFVFEIFEPLSGGSIKKLPIYMRPALTTMAARKLLKSSMPPSKINSTGPLTEKLLLK